MKLSMIGLGKMGANMVRRLAYAGHEIVIYDISKDVSTDLENELNGVVAVNTLDELIKKLPSPKVVWLMVPHQHVDKMIEDILNAGLSSGDIIVDGGNSNYKLSQKRGEMLQQRGVHFVDSGTSGGVWGLENGYSLMVGGSDEAIQIIKPALKTLAPSDESGWGHVGPVGAGHYVKMVHNGIEYGMMQAYAEGFELMHSKHEMDLDMHQISRIWQHGSVVRSWLLDLIADALEQDIEMSELSDFVDDSGEGRWTIQDSIENAVPIPVLTLALQMRFRSRQDSSYSARVLNAMRAGFGGHTIKSK